MIPTLLGITVVSFLVIRSAPGDPSELLEQQGGEVRPKSEEVAFEKIDEFRRRYNLDKPLHIQYWTWLQKVLFFDFGESLVKPGKQVNELIAEALPVTMILSIAAIFLTYLIAIPLGVMSSVWENNLLDRIITVLLFMLYSLPSFFVAIWLLNLLASDPNIAGKWALGLPVKIFPAQGLSIKYSFVKFLYHMVLPLFCLTFASYAYLSRQMRGGMLEVLRMDYIRTARAKGLNEKVVTLKHGLKNALIPIVTIASSILPALIGGSVIIEKIFNIDGMGRLGFDAILSRDYNVIMALLYLSSLLTLLGILISDILYVLVNPSITFEQEK